MFNERLASCSCLASRGYCCFRNAIRQFRLEGADADIMDYREQKLLRDDATSRGLRAVGRTLSEPRVEIFVPLVPT